LRWVLILPAAGECRRRLLDFGGLLSVSACCRGSGLASGGELWPCRQARSRAPAPSAPAALPRLPAAVNMPDDCKDGRQGRTTLGGGRTHSPGAASPSLVWLPLSLAKRRYIFCKQGALEKIYKNHRFKGKLRNRALDRCAEPGSLISVQALRFINCRPRISYSPPATRAIASV